jgi:hypothetical protein
MRGDSWYVRRSRVQNNISFQAVAKFCVVVSYY